MEGKDEDRKRADSADQLKCIRERNGKDNKNIRYDA